MVVAGEAADRRGPLIPFLAAVFTFGLGLLLAGLADTMWWFVAGRAVQGFGAGLNIVALYVVAGRAFHESLRPRLFSVMSSAWILPAIIGPTIAGLVADRLSWRWVFLAVPPLIVPAVLLMLPRLVTSRQLPMHQFVVGASSPHWVPRSPWRCCSTPGSASTSSPSRCSRWRCRCWWRPCRGCFHQAHCVPRPGYLPRSSCVASSPARSSAPRRSSRSCSSRSAASRQRWRAHLDRGSADVVARLLDPGQPAHEGGEAPVDPGRNCSGGNRHRADVAHALARAAATRGGDRVGDRRARDGPRDVERERRNAALSPRAEHGFNSAALQLCDAFGSIVLIGLAGAIFAKVHGAGSGDAVANSSARGSVAAYLLIYAVTAAVAFAGARLARRLHAAAAPAALTSSPVTSSP